VQTGRGCDIRNLMGGATCNKKKAKKGPGFGGKGIRHTNKKKGKGEGRGKGEKVHRGQRRGTRLPKKKKD